MKEVVEAYISGGFTHFGISEHQPRPKGSLYADEIEIGRTIEFLFERFNMYFTVAKSLQEEFQDKAHILIGFETEICNKDSAYLIADLRKKYAPEYKEN